MSPHWCWPGYVLHGRHHVDTPTTLPELSIPIQPRWSESNISPYSTSVIGRPKGPVVLRNITINKNPWRTHDHVNIYIIKHGHLMASSLKSSIFNPCKRQYILQKIHHRLFKYYHFQFMKIHTFKLLLLDLSSTNKK